MRVDGALVALEVVAQHLLHQLHARVHATRVAGQRGEQLELAGGEIDLLVVDQHFVPRHVDGELAELQHFALRLGIGVHAAQKRAGASNQLAGAERLHQVVVGAQLQTDDAVFHLALSGEHDNGHVGVVADGAADALARHAGQHEVEDDKIEVVLRELLERLLAVADRRHPVILAFKIGRHGVADGLFVFNQKDASCFVAHGSLLKLADISDNARPRSLRGPVPSVLVVFAFIVAIRPKGALTCA